MDSRVKNKNASTQNSTYNFRGVGGVIDSLKLIHGSQIMEEELLIAISIENSMPIPDVFSRSNSMQQMKINTLIHCYNFIKSSNSN